MDKDNETVVPFVLKALRNRRRLTQKGLAERAKVDKQTVYRLEADTRERSSTRRSTVDALARALRTDPEILIGKRPLPVAEEDDRSVLEMSKLNTEVSTQMRNAMYLVSERYNVKYSDILELAPFLFCWVAEASLRQRKERLLRMEAALKELQDADSDVKHLHPLDLSEVEEKIKHEKGSIEYHDIWGITAEGYVEGKYPFDTPFAEFLNSLTDEMGNDASLDEYCWSDFPSYRVCQKEAMDLFGADAELADEILQGHIALHQMPKELRELGKRKERADWARAKLEDFRRLLSHSRGLHVRTNHHSTCRRTHGATRHSEQRCRTYCFDWE